MTEKRAVLIIRRSLKRLIKQNSVEGSPKAGYRKCLKGSALARSQAVKKAREYLAAMAVKAPDFRATPPALNGLVAELRKSATNLQLHCTVRIQSLEKLLRMSGFSCGVHHHDNTDELIDSALGITTPENSTPTAVKVRSGARNQALADIRAAFEQDRATGCFKTVADVVIRLPEHPAPEKPEPRIDVTDEFNAFVNAGRKDG